MDGMKTEPWDFWIDGAHDPAFNMAADEALMLSAPLRGRPLLRFYEWDRPAVSIGYVQTIAAAPEGYAAVRRPTGGGVVYHDYDFTYTVMFPVGHWLCDVDRVASYDWINRSVQNGLERLDLKASLSSAEIPHSVDRLTMVCFVNPTKYDIMLGGRKVGGGAQRRVREGILHQGSLHFGGPLPVLRHVMQAAILEGFRAVMGMRPVTFTPSPEFWGLTLSLRSERYNSDAWNRKR